MQLHTLSFVVLCLSCAIFTAEAVPVNTTYHLDEPATVTRMERAPLLSRLIGRKEREVVLGKNIQQLEIVQPSEDAPLPEVIFEKKNGEPIHFHVTKSFEHPAALQEAPEPYPAHETQESAASPNEVLIKPLQPEGQTNEPGQLRRIDENATLPRVDQGVEVPVEEYDRTKDAQSTYARLRTDPASVLPALQRQADAKTSDELPAYNATARPPKPTVVDEEDEELHTVTPAEARQQERLYRKIESDRALEEEKPLVRERASSPVRFYEHLDDRPKVPEWVWVVVAAVGGLAVLASTILYFRRRRSFEHGKIVDKTQVPIRRLTTPIVVV